MLSLRHFRLLFALEMTPRWSIEPRSGGLEVFRKERAFRVSLEQQARYADRRIISISFLRLIRAFDMKKIIYRFCCSVIPIIAMLFAILDGRCAGMPGLSIQRLVAQSDLIVVAKIIKVAKIADGQVNIHGQIFPADIMEAAAQAAETLKGVRQDSMLVIRFAVPISPAGSVGYGRLISQQDRLLFLRNFPPDGGYQPTNPYYPSLPAARTRNVISNSERDVNPTKLKEVEAQVVSIECQTISSGYESSSARMEAIWSLKGVADTCLASALHKAFESSDRDLRLTAAAALLKLNDIQVLGAAIREADQLPIDSYLRLNLASAIRDGIRSKGAVLDIVPMLKSKDPRMRRAAASALHNIGTVSCVPGLVIALSDEDKDTRYYAVIGLGEIERQPDQKPSMEDFDRNPSSYVSYWQAWANGHENRNRHLREQNTVP